MAKLADAPGLDPGGSDPVSVRVRVSPQNTLKFLLTPELLLCNNGGVKFTSCLIAAFFIFGETYEFKKFGMVYFLLVCIHQY